jgi:hypothetical protein
MRIAHPRRILLAAIAVLSAPIAAHAQDLTASAPVDVSVTVYRDPFRGEGGFDLDNLNGFALITETRRVVLTPGQHRLRFEGVADGIEPASAIVTGLPSGVIEKNRDAALLSPAALVDAAEAQQGRVLLSRTAPNGITTRHEGVIRSGAEGGVVFETPDGVEALRCSGLAETVTFESTRTGLSAQPTLSVLTRVNQRIEATVQLSYLARGFDWAADYVVSLSPDGRKLDVGGWITLANGNGTGFPNARVQIVAGRLNRDSGEIEPIDFGRPILARCWPRGSTSDSPDPVYIERAYPLGFEPGRYSSRAYMAMPAPPAAMAMAESKMDDVVVTGARRAEQEDLGDLKLYRVPDRSTVASRQAKQVRLLDSLAVPISRVYDSDLYPNNTIEFQPMEVILRTQNDTASNLGIPLPSGRVSVFETAGSGTASRRLLAGETNLRDLAVNEETEFLLSGGAAVQIRQTTESRQRPDAPPPGVKGQTIRTGARFNMIDLVEITNAHPFPIQAEVSVYLADNEELVRADRDPERKNGRPIFRVTVPANESLEFRYQTAEYN